MATPASSPAIAKTPSGTQQEGETREPDVQTPLIAAGLTVAGAIGVAFLVNWLNGRREKQARFVTAATAFRAAFDKDLAALETMNYTGSDPMDFLRVAHNERHAQAVVAFEPFIPVGKRRQFREDWQRYCYGTHEDGSPMTPATAEMDHNDLLCLSYTRESHLGNPGAARLLAIERMRKLFIYVN